MTAADGITEPDSAPGEADVRAQLERIAGSPDFDTSQRSRDFLRFVVEETLAGRTQAISQHAIASRVFGRRGEFDPATDPIVRMQAGRVRRSLDHYYLTAGRSDRILIGLPKGRYVPTFRYREPQPGPAAPDATRDAVETWPTLLVSPLRNLTGRPEVEFIAQGLAFDLAAELNQYGAIGVFLSRGAAPEPSGARLPQFELTGALALRGDDLRVTLHLVDTRTGGQTWAHTFTCGAGLERGAALDEVVQTTAATVAEERGVLASQFVSPTPRRPRAAGSVYEAILRTLYLETTHEPQAFDDALAALRQAVRSSPGCALAWSYLARIGAIQFGLGLPGDVIPIEDSIAAARRGAELAPLDVQSLVILAYVLLLGDELDEARAQADAALRVSSGSVFWLDAVGYLLTLSGDWERGPDMIRKAVQINPFPRRACYCGLWLDALRRRDPEEALDAARKSAPEAYFWSPLMQAVALVAAGRGDGASVPIQQLLEIRPDFPERGRWLIARYVKDKDLARRIEDALESAGLALTPVDGRS
ncbi:MAG: hypothetical protein ACF8R7_13130 [Phycisphaerales bacterium JB039]